MIRPFFVFLAPLGCLLMLLFTSLTPFPMMSLIGEMMQPGSRVSNVTFMAPVGGLGAVDRVGQEHHRGVGIEDLVGEEQVLRLDALA